MKLIYSPGACSLGIHVLLEEIGAPYDAEVANLREPVPQRPLTAINPKSKVPTLVRDDGSVLTEYPAIAYFLAASHPQSRLWPEGVEDQTRALEVLDYLVATVHMRGFARLFSPERFGPAPEDADKVRAQGKEIAENGLKLLSERLGSQDYLFGTFSAADTALFYVSMWAAKFRIEMPENIAGHLARMKARPAVAAVLKKEGLS